jgi:hypothetical protein
MNYELAKRLKEARFPIIQLASKAVGAFDYCIFCGRKFIRIEDDIFLEPTLEELIEACGNEVEELENTFDGWRAYARSTSETYWAADICEAVAALWLALNEKKV